MAALLHDPVPTQAVVGYAINRPIIHLFTKTINATDMKKGLTLIGAALYYFRSWKHLHTEINGHGFNCFAFAPGVVGQIVVVVKMREDMYKLRKQGWSQLCQQAGFATGNVIHCWAVYVHGPNGEPGPFQLLFEAAAQPQPAANQAVVAQ